MRRHGLRVEPATSLAVGSEDRVDWDAGCDVKRGLGGGASD